MSEAPPETCDVDALLNEVAALDMALLRHVNAQALAATDPDTLNGLVRSQQRLARSVRTTLATKARLAARRDGEGQAEARPAAAPVLYSWQVRDAQDRAESAARAAAREGGHDPESALKAAVVERLRLEYDPAEVEAIDHELYDMIDEVWEDGGFARELPAERLHLMLGHVRSTFGPSRTRTPAPAPPEPSEPPQGGPEPAEARSPEPSPGPSTPQPRDPPWDRRPPHALDPGGGGSD